MKQFILITLLVLSVSYGIAAPATRVPWFLTGKYYVVGGNIDPILIKHGKVQELFVEDYDMQPSLELGETGAILWPRLNGTTPFDKPPEKKHWNTPIAPGLHSGRIIAMGCSYDKEPTTFERLGLCHPYSYQEYGKKKLRHVYFTVLAENFAFQIVYHGYLWVDFLAKYNRDIAWPPRGVATLRIIWIRKYNPMYEKQTLEQRERWLCLWTKLKSDYRIPAERPGLAAIHQARAYMGYASFPTILLYRNTGYTYYGMTEGTKLPTREQIASARRLEQRLRALVSWINK